MTTGSGANVLLDEHFSGGLVVGQRWHHVETPGFVSDDATATATPSGLSIAPPTRNPDTGEPMFTKEVDGFAGHLKWMVVSAGTFPATGGPLRVRFRGGARSFGTSRHPYGSAVADAAEDIRLGSATLNLLDFETGMVFDFWLNSSVIVPYYERIRPPDLPIQYAAFGSVGAPVARRPDDVHDFAIIVDVDQGTARWELDGTIVAEVDGIGPPHPDWATVLHHGGRPDRATPRQFQVGMALMTLLDAAYPPMSTGLVDIGMRTELPATFATAGPTLFGQGVALDLHHVVVDRP